jgi:hypothetical protein
VLVETPDEKLCPYCGITKPASEYTKDLSRRDGLKHGCTLCTKDQTRKRRERRTFTDYDKKCEVCERLLPARLFLYSQTSDDHLEPKCMYCRCWRSRKQPCTKEQAAEYEEFVKTTVLDAKLEMHRRYGDSSSATIEQHRTEFEYTFARLFSKNQAISRQWKLPIWIHASSSLWE